MLREHGKRSKGVVHHRVRRKLRLIGNGIRYPAACEAVGNKSREASLVQVAHPHTNIEADATRTMHEDDGWQPVGSGLWNAQLARYHRGLAIFFPEQEIRGAECDRRHRTNLGAEDGLCPCGFQQEDRASDCERANQGAGE
jgi:hypothetical protein